MAYCTVSDVQALAWVRPIGVGSNPGASQVTTYINMAAGEIDAILVNKGYNVPVNTASYPEAGAFLQGANAKGALVKLEEASPTSPNLDRAEAAYNAALKMLSDTQFVFDLPMNTQRSEPRGPWQTLQPTGQVYDPMLDGWRQNDPYNQPRNPFLSRQMRF